MRWISRPERVLRRASAGFVVLLGLEVAGAIAGPDPERPALIGALTGCGVALAVLILGSVRLKRSVRRVTWESVLEPCEDRPWFTAQLLEDFPMDRIRRLLLADPDGLHLNRLYAAWSCAVLGCDAQWLEDRFALNAGLADLLVAAAHDGPGR